jgi:hypothetical protein
MPSGDAAGRAPAVAAFAKERGMTLARIVVGVAGAVVVAALLTRALPAHAESRRGERVSITGCPFTGVVATCLMIRGQGGTLYNISAASPRPRGSERMIRVRGTVTDRPSRCGPGVVLERIRFTRTRQRCSR